jgi:hypothetical protein
MSKFSELSLENENVMNEAFVKSGLDHVINLKFLGDDRQKTIYKVQKSSALVKFETNNDVYIIINELIFDQLEELQKIMIAEESLGGLTFNYEKDKLDIKKGDVHTFSGFLKKYGYDKYEVLTESIKTLYNIKQEDATV